MPFQSKVSIILYKWLPSRCEHLENIYISASRQAIEPSTSSLFSTSTTNLSTGCSRYLEFWFALSTDPINSLTLRTTSLSSLSLGTTFAIGHLFLSISSFTSTISLVLQFCILSFHFCLFWSVNSTSFLHLLQNSLDKCCTCLQCFLQYTSADIKTPGADITTLHFVSRLIGLNGTRLVTLITSVVSGRELIIASTSVKKVCKGSSVKLAPCVFNNELRIFRAVLIWNSQTPPILLASGVVSLPSNPFHTVLLQKFPNSYMIHLLK